MLSRIAESMFWIGRYVERAEDTARILDVQTQLMLEDPTVDEQATCRTLLSIMGVPYDEDLEVNRQTILELLAYDTLAPASIAAALASARESARRARETLSEPLWEAVNTTWRALPSGRFRTLRPPAVFGWVRDRAALINGTAEATMTRDEGYQFLVLGRSIERADMTARLVATASLTSSSASSAWTTTLRACGAYEAFLRTYRGLETDRGAAEFLLLDRLFPRSIVHSISRAEQCLDNLESGGSRAGFGNDAQRLLGRTRADLEYRSLSDVVANLPAEMERLQYTCAAATDSVTRRYFAGSEATEWHGGGKPVTMQLRITHTTGYEYDGKAITSYNEARLTPQTSPEQIVVHTRLDITPTPWTHTYRDYFGTQVTSFEVLDPHDSLTVQAHATVHTNRGPLPAPTLSWEDLATPEVSDVHTEFLMMPDLVAPPEDFASRVKEIGAQAATPGEAAIAVCALVHSEVEYLPGSTEVNSRAGQAWEQRGGVCQDMAHLAIGGLRTLGIPTRYVSGYFHPSADPEVGTTVAGESHAWVEWWDEGWHAFDLTNDQPISDRHVVIAAGRDYADVRPLSGIFAGARTSRMFVEVEVTRLA